MTTKICSIIKLSANSFDLKIHVEIFTPSINIKYENTDVITMKSEQIKSIVFFLFNTEKKK